jgi:hypothetical protein
MLPMALISPGTKIRKQLLLGSICIAERQNAIPRSTTPISEKSARLTRSQLYQV